MSNIIYDNIATYLQSLTATNEIIDALGTSLVIGNNLFIGFEPDTDYDSITLIPYPGRKPENDGYRQNPSVQIRLKTSNRAKSMKVQQAIINKLHMNTVSGACLMKCNNSAPILLGDLEGGEWKISTTNFNLKHVKV